MSLVPCRSLTNSSQPSRLSTATLWYTNAPSLTGMMYSVGPVGCFFLVGSTGLQMDYSVVNVGTSAGLGQGLVFLRKDIILDAHAARVRG